MPSLVAHRRFRYTNGADGGAAAEPCRRLMLTMSAFDAMPIFVFAAALIVPPPASLPYSVDFAIRDITLMPAYVAALLRRGASALMMALCSLMFTLCYAPAAATNALYSFRAATPDAMPLPEPCQQADEALFAARFMRHAADATP